MSTAPDPVSLDTLLGHRDWVRAVARRLVADPATVDDVEQDTWLAAMRSPPREAGTVRGWLARVVRNLVLDRARAGRRRRAYEDASPRREAPPGAADAVALADLHKRVVFAVMQLDEPYRSTLLLRFFEDLPPRDVAQRLGVPVETVRTRTRRGLERLRTQFDAEHGGDRRAWSMLLLPLLGGTAPPMVGPGRVTPPSDTSGALYGSAVGSAATGAVIVASTTNKVLIGAAAVIAILVGTLALNELVGPTSESPVRLELAGRGTDWSAAVPTEVESQTSRGPGAPLTAATGSIRVLVRDQLGAVVAGARVSVFLVSDDASGFWSDWHRQDAATRATPGLASALTDAAGRAVFAGIDAAEYRVVARAEGLAQAESWARVVRDGEPPEVPLVLGVARELRGIVLDHDGSRLADALVTASPDFSIRTRTAENGRFALTDLARGLLILHVARPGGDAYEVARVRVPEVSEITLRLGGGALAGRILDDATDEPIPGAHVRAYAGTRVAAAVRTHSDRDGRYELRTSMDGPLFRIAVDVEGYDPVPVNDIRELTETSLAGGMVAQLDLRLRRGGAAMGVVRSASGPVGGVYVTAHWSREEVIEDQPGLSHKSFHDSPGVVSAADGSFRLDGLPPGRVLLQGRHVARVQPGFPESWHSATRTETDGFAVDVPVGGIARHDILMSGFGRVSGRVLDTAGKPVAGAVVVAPGGLTPAVSAADGTYLLTEVPPGDETAIWAWRTGYSAAIGSAAVREGRETSGVVLTLGDEILLFGRVVGANGARITDAYVQVTGALPEDIPADFVEQAFMDGPRYPVDVDGHFTVPLVAAPGVLVVRAVAAGYQAVLSDPVAVPEGATRVRVDLEFTAGGVVAGVVREATGRPVVGAAVQIGTAGSDRIRDLPITAITASDGSFRVAGLRAAEYDVLVASIDGRSARATVRAPGTVAVVLPASQMITGRVVFPDGSPAAGVRVQARERTPDNSHGGQSRSIGVTAPGAMDRTMTADDGTFELGPLAPGDYDITVVADSKSGSIVRHTVAPAVPVGTRSLRIEAARGGVLSGFVSDERGAPLAGVTVFVTDRTTRQVWGVQTSRDGGFRAVGLGDGDVSIKVNATAEDGTPLEASLDAVPPGSEGVRLVALPALLIRGRVVTPTGDAAAGAMVEITDDDGIRVTAKCEDEGRFEVSGLTIGRRYRVRAWTPGWALTTVEAGVGDEVLIRLTPGLSASGRLVDAEGNPLANVELGLLHSENGGPAAGSTDVDGNFRITGLEAGTYMVRARLSGTDGAEQVVPCGELVAGTDGVTLSAAK